RQAPVIEALSRTTGLEVMAVAIDHMPMPSGHFAGTYVPDQGQSQMLGVTTVPAVAIMRPPNDIRMVGQGNMTLAELSRRILVVARQAGWISEKAYEATLPVRRATQTLAAELIDDVVLEDPASFVDHLRARMTPTRSPGAFQ
ncbi:MAG: conjugal transfer protein TraF, partial [Pseudomonadota bacterium]